MNTETKFDTNLFQEALKSVSGQSWAGTPVTGSTIAFFEKFLIPKELQSFLVSNSFDRPIEFGHIYLYSVNTLEGENCKEQNKNCIDEGLLIVGSGLNGDPVVIDTKTLKMGFVFHDELWESREVKARSAYIDVGLSIGKFYFDAITKKDTFPVDAYMAEEMHKKQ